MRNPKNNTSIRSFTDFTSCSNTKYHIKTGKAIAKNRKRHPKAVIAMACGCLLSRTDCPWFTLFPYPFSLNHPEVFQGLLDCLFFIRRALGLFSVLRLRLIVVLTLDDNPISQTIPNRKAYDRARAKQSTRRNPEVI